MPGQLFQLPKKEVFSLWRLTPATYVRKFSTS
jgi:hypothetical protein